MAALGEVMDTSTWVECANGSLLVPCAVVEALNEEREVHGGMTVEAAQALIERWQRKV